MADQPIQDTISYLLIKVAKAHRSRVGAGLAGLGLHVGQEMVLLRLWDEDGLSQTELAARLHIEPPTVTKVLHRMERAGLVTRRPDPDDARVSRVYLTERGRALREPVLKVWAAGEERMLAGLTADERRQLRLMLSRMRQNLD